MNEQDEVKIRRKALRRGYLVFGLPFYLVINIGFFRIFSGPVGLMIVIYIATMASAAFAVYLWSYWMWVINKSEIIKSAKFFAENEKKRKAGDRIRNQRSDQRGG
ncbi:MAG TPA: hypothetical protein VF457_11805 [Burkholderiaceae bacterium]